MDEELTFSLLNSQKAAGAGKVRRVGPPDYEKELLARKEELREDEFPNLLLFPQQDVLVESEQRQYRTDQCSVPQDALQGHTNLFTSQCLKFYQSDLHRVKFKFSKYAGSHVNLIDEEDQQGLPPLVFEQDQIDAERSQQEEHVVGSEPKSTLSKAGYLLKGPFPSEAGHSVSMKTYRKRWFELRGGPTHGGYSLVQCKDKNSTVKGKINLETCTDIKRNNRYKALGFDILTGDDKVYYPLAAESETDMEQWITVLSKAIGLDTEETAVPVRPYSHETLRDHQKKSMMRPELLQHSSITEQVDAAHREDDRNELFILYPEIMDYCSPPVELTPPPLPKEETGVLVRVSCQELRLKLVTNRGRQQDLVEPFFVTLALYDAMKGRKISEDFHVDLNTAELRRMVASGQRPSPAGSREGGTDIASMANNVREAVFSVMFPHTEVYLVVRVDKVFQGSIQSCAEPYIKQGDSTKIADKLSSTMPRICERLGQYHMPFAWGVRPLFTSGDQLDTTSDFSPLYRQERERMSCEDLLRILADYKSLHKLKLQTIPGTFRVSVSKTSETGAASRLTLSPSLLSLKGRSGGAASSSSTPVAREIREFPPLKSFEPHSHYSSHLSFIHHLYVYPSSLKYDSQKSFTKARNIAVCMQVKDSDNKDAKPLPVIFSDRIGEAFTDHIFTTILHHCTTPTFYTEVKIKLPVQVTSTHHVLFTFHHVGCESQKTATIKRSSTKSAPSVENIVGYSWLPLSDTSGSRIVSGRSSLPVSANLPPGYLRAKDSPQRPTTPDIKWVDGNKPLFTVRTSLDSTIHTLDSKLSTFFAVCTHVAKGKRVPPDDLKSVTENLDDMSTSSLQYLPVLLNQLFHMICSLSGPLHVIKADVLSAVMSLVERTSAIGRRDQLEQYVEYVFLTEVDSSTQLSTHDELARLMLHFLLERDRDDCLRVVKHLWFLLGIMAKSMSQYLSICGKDSTSSRKNRFLEDFGWHVKSMVFALLPILTDSAIDNISIIANSSLALFLRRAFNLMDRGLVFTMVAKYFEAFDQQEREDLIDMRLEFLWSLCCHEHYIALNLPFNTKAANQHFTLNASYCEKHYLSGVLLQEVEAAIKSGSLLIRKKAIMILRNLLAKHESDDRYSLPAQKARVASLYLPLITMVMDSVDKLQWREGESADRKASSSDQESSSTQAVTGSEDTSAAGGGGGKKVSVTSSSSTSSGISQFLNPRKGDRKGSSPNNRFKSVNSKTSFNPPSSPLATVESKTSLELVDVSPLQTSPQASLLGLREKQSEEKVEENSYQLSREETKSLLLCLLFVLKYTDQGVLQHWWRKCLTEENTATRGSQRYSWSGAMDERTSQPQLLCFFDLLKICIHVFKYAGKSAIFEKSSGRATLLRELEHTYMYHRESLQKSGGSRRSLAVSLSSVSAGPGNKRSMIGGPTGAQGLSPEEADLRAKAEGALANEVGLTIIELLEGFSKYFKETLSQGCGDNALMNKYFAVLMAFLQVRQSTVLQSHVFAALRTFTHKYAVVLFKGSSMQCGALCYEAMLCCNSRVASTRAEATALLYLLMKTNFEYFKQQGFVRTQLQTTVALSKIMAGSLPESHAQLRRSLSIIPTYADHDDHVKTTSFLTEVKDLVLRLKTILSSVAQMKEHRNDPEKLTDLHYNLTKSYANSPQLRFTWLESMAKLHTNYGNYSEVAQCYLHMAGLIGEYLKGIGKFSGGCAVLRLVSPNIEMEEGGMKTDKETSKEQYYSEEDIVQLLENALTYLEKAERYELMNDVLKILLPFYERERNYIMMMEMYGRLHEAFTKVVSIMKTGKRYLGTYFRVAFYGHYFGDDNEKQYVYKEPKVTSLTELTQRLQRLYTRKFGPDIVQIIMESGKVNPSSLDPTKAFIQVTHVVPYFTQAELAKRPTKFEQENRLSSFVFETPFTMVGQARGTVASQCIRKTILTTSHWFPYVKKRILIIDQRQFELSPIEVAIEAMEKKRGDLVMEVRREPPDLVKLQLLLQGSISTQVNQGVQEYANVFLKDSITDTRQQKHHEQHIEQLKKLFRMFMQVCQEALDIHGSLINEEQYLWQEELKGKFRHMQVQLSPLLSLHQKKVSSSTSSSSLSTSGHSAADMRRSPK